VNWRLSVFTLEWRKILAYRSDFWITFLGQVFVQLFVARAFWQVFFDTKNVTELEGYTLDDLVLYYLVATVGGKVMMSESMGFFSREIYDGSFSKYLLFPLSVFQYKAVTFMASSLYYAFLLVVLYVIYLTLFGASGNVAGLCAGVALFLIAGVVYMQIAMLVELGALWVDNVWTIMVMLKIVVSLISGQRLPLAFFPPWAIDVLKWTPFPYLISLPTQVVMGRGQLEEIARGLLVCAVWSLLLYGLIGVVWKRGQKRYTGVGI
jgi:ABC-2 type transport system permease protein